MSDLSTKSLFSLQHRALMITLAITFYVYDYFIQVMPSVMTHDLMLSLHLNAQSLGWLSAGFFYTYLLMQIPVGLLLDQYSTRSLLSLAVLVSGFGVVLFGLAHGPMSALLGRAFVGFGSAFAYLSTLSLIAQHSPHRHFAWLAGVAQCGACVGALVGLAPMAALVHHLGWRATSYVIGMITVLASLSFYLVIRDQPTHSHSDISRHLKHKIIATLRRPYFLIVACCGLISWMPVGSIGGLWGVPYLIAAQHISTIEASSIVSLFWIGLGVGSVSIGWISQHTHHRRLLLTVCFTLGAVASVLLLFAAPLPRIVAYFACFLLGLACSVQSFSFALVKDIVPPQYFATASSLTNMAAIAGAGLAQILFGIFIHHTAQPLVGYQRSIGLLLIMSLIGVLLSCLCLPARWRNTSQLDPSP